MIDTVAPALTHRRSRRVVVASSALTTVVEDGLAAAANAADALERAIAAVAVDQAYAVHQLQRAAFELGELRPALARLAFVADNAAPLQS